jgi:hypothetical protein
MMAKQVACRRAPSLQRRRDLAGILGAWKRVLGYAAK